MSHYHFCWPEKVVIFPIKSIGFRELNVRLYCHSRRSLNLVDLMVNLVFIRSLSLVILIALFAMEISSTSCNLLKKRTIVHPLTFRTDERKIRKKQHFRAQPTSFLHNPHKSKIYTQARTRTHTRTHTHTHTRQPHTSPYLLSSSSSSRMMWRFFLAFSWNF